MATPLAGLIHTFSRLSMVQQLLLNIDFCRFWSLNIFEPSMTWAEAAQNKRCVYTVYIYIICLSCLDAIGQICGTSWMRPVLASVASGSVTGALLTLAREISNPSFQLPSPPSASEVCSLIPPLPQAWNKVPKSEEVLHELLVLMLPRVSSRVSGFPVAPPAVSVGEAAKLLIFERFQAVSVGEAAKPLSFGGFQAGCHVVLLGRKLVLCVCGKRNTFASFSQDELQFSWQAQHFGDLCRQSAWQAQHFRRVTLRALHTTLHTLHSTLHTSHSTLYTLHSTLLTQHFTLHTPHFTLHTLDFTLYTPPSTFYTLHYALHTLHFTLHTQHFTLHTLHFTFHTLHFTLHTPCSTL